MNWKKITGLAITGVLSMPYLMQAEMKSAPERFAPFIENRQLPGIVVIAADADNILAVDAAGFADIEHKISMKTDSLFWVASETKTLIAGALMLLRDEDKVQIDDPVEKFLPEFKNMPVAVKKEDGSYEKKPAARAITIKDLLTHVSGISGSQAMAYKPLREIVAGYAEIPLESEPGAVFKYSNPGINTVGAIIEVISGEPLGEFMQCRIFDPLGMKNTTFWPTPAQLQHLAKTYQLPNEKTGNQFKVISYYHFEGDISDRSRPPFPGGGLFSTGEDIIYYYQMLLNGGEFNGRRILSAAAVKEMTARQDPTGISDRGLALVIGNSGEFRHSGAYGTETIGWPAKNLITGIKVQIQGGWPEKAAVRAEYFKWVDDVVKNQHR
ncbi:MAG: serine hydrolase domain-containing protein [Kiritimatiellales bacterium]